MATGMLHGVEYLAGAGQGVIQMRRRWVLVAVMVLMAVAAVSQTLGPVGAPQPADVNGDGRIGIDDAVLVVRMAVGLLSPNAPVQAGLPNGPATQAQIEHGRYLVLAAGCGYCHTPSGVPDNPNDPLWLSGYNANVTGVGMGGMMGGTAAMGSLMPMLGGMGMFMAFPANITPDPDTGIGTWSAAQIFTALRTGRDDEGQYLRPPMPWPAYREFADSDLWAIAAYIKSIKAVKNEVPDFAPPIPIDWNAYYAALPPAFPAYPGKNEVP